MDRVEFEDLPGVYLLSGVQFATTEVDSFYDDSMAQQILFVLDDVTYVATENPSDGYRSSLGYIARTLHPVINRFPPVRVVAVLRSAAEDDYYTHNIVDFVDLESMKVVMSIGTDNLDDYYPWFVAQFNPENLSVNAHIQEQLHAGQDTEYENEHLDHGDDSTDGEPADYSSLDELSQCGIYLRRRNRSRRTSPKRRE